MLSAQTVYPGPKRPGDNKGKKKCCRIPPCRICSVNVALGAFLIGLVVAGIGAAVAAFQWHEEFVRGICMFMVVGGFLAICGAAGLFIWDRMQLYKSIRAGDPSLYVCDLRSSLRRSGSFTNPQKLDAANLQQNNKPQEPPPSYDSLHKKVETSDTTVVTMKQLEYQKNSTADSRSIKTTMTADNKSVKSTTSLGQSSRISEATTVVKNVAKTPTPSYDDDSLTTISYSIPKQFLPKNFQQQQASLDRNTQDRHKSQAKNVVPSQPQLQSEAKVSQKQLITKNESVNNQRKIVSTDV